MNNRTVHPVEPEVGFSEVEMPAASGADQAGDRLDEVPDEGPQFVLAGGLGRQVEAAPCIAANAIWPVAARPQALFACLPAAFQTSN